MPLKNNGAWKLGATGFCTTWKKAKATSELFADALRIQHVGIH
jgi:hypothetical protein